MKRFFYLTTVLLTLYFTKTNAQSLAGTYTVTGYFFHPSLPRTENLTKTLTAINDSVYEASVGDLATSNNYYFQFTINASNQLVKWQPIGSTPADTTSGFMTSDNPGNFSYYPGTTTGFTSDVYNNTYDPVNKTFYMHYGYNNAGNSDTGQASYSRQIYEKWVLTPKPIITSFSPANGTVGTQVTIKGSGFNDAFRVYFGGISSDSFRVASDTEIVATVGGGRTGQVSINNYISGVANYFAYSADSFFYTPPVVHDTSWHPAGSKGFSAGAANYVSIAMDTAGLPYVVYQDKANGNVAMVMHLDKDSTWKAVGGQASTGSASFTNIAIGSDNVPYIAYIDSATINGTGISVRKFSGSGWQTVGMPVVDTFTNRPYSNSKVALALDSANEPYILGAAYTVFGYYNFYVHKFNGTEWETVGRSDVGIESGLGDASMAIDKATNTIYVVSDIGYGSLQATVARYRNNVWDTIPSGYITNNSVGVYYPDIAIDKWGDPYVSFQDDNGPEQVSVYSLTGNRFYPVGNKYFSANHAYNVSLTIGQGGITPYVFYSDGSFNGSGTVMTPNINGNGSWQYLGSRGFAPSVILSGNAIVTDKTGVPYVAFADSSNGYKATVLKYGGYDLFAPRTRQELYSDSACRPWVKSPADWTSYYSGDTTGLHIEMQTQFQDEPGNLCGFQSYIDSSSTYRTQLFGDANVVLSPRNYRIQFSDSNFTHPVGIRLFGRTAEIDELVKQANKYSTDEVKVFRYDGPNEDYLPGNNTNGSAVYNDSAHGVYNTYNYTFIQPVIHYYGTNNEYYYIEFSTDHFSEFYIGIPTAFLLPVNLLSFTATVHDKNTLVSWQTNNEVNTSSFTVQRSTDGVHFTNIGKVNAAGTGGNHAYSYQDDLSGITATKVYYRLQITDKDGSTKTSNLVNVNLAGNKLITIQPNPAHNYAVLTCNVEGRKTITITDINGRKVFSKTTANSSETVSVSSFAKGIYLVRIEYTGGTEVRKLVVE